MRPATRIALLAAVVVIAVVGFIVLKPDDNKDQQASNAGSTTPAATTSTTTPTTTPTDEPPSPPPVANVKVGKDGKPVGGVQHLEFGKGQRVQFFVTSQVADEVHVHGYDIMEDVKPGKPAKFSFEGDISGQFEVELEGRGEQIIELKVGG